MPSWRRRTGRRTSTNDSCFREYAQLPLCKISISMPFIPCISTAHPPHHISNLYAQGTSKHVRAFNCVQRSHQHIFETFTTAAVSGLAGAVTFPITTAVSTLMYSVGKISCYIAYYIHSMSCKTNIKSDSIYFGKVGITCRKDTLNVAREMQRSVIRTLWRNSCGMDSSGMSFSGWDHAFSLYLGRRPFRL